MITFKGVDIAIETDAYVCPVCGLEAGTVATAGVTQQRIADAYRAKKQLLTGEEIKRLRKARHLTQQQMAEQMKVGIASIKRWETGTVQSEAMDHAMRIQLQCKIPNDLISGNRELSLPRIKLVANHFETFLKFKLLVKGDRFLFVAKYLWYADMLAFRSLGRSMTGATSPFKVVLYFFLSARILAVETCGLFFNAIRFGPGFLGPRGCF
jgi:putative zinc finger/helix-turn-helix YgiT family protein